jgi:hypothetical protein
MHWRNEILRMSYGTYCRINFIIPDEAVLIYNFYLQFLRLATFSFDKRYLSDTDI